MVAPTRIRICVPRRRRNADLRFRLPTWRLRVGDLQCQANLAGGQPSRLRGLLIPESFLLHTDEVIE